MPWIEALRRKRDDEAKGKKDSDQPGTPKDRDLSPKRMSDSYYSVILPLARDPWLSDTYLNADGNIRCAKYRLAFLHVQD
jgi:acyl-coenzyme A thioesterase 9